MPMKKMMKNMGKKSNKMGSGMEKEGYHKMPDGTMMKDEYMDDEIEYLPKKKMSKKMTRKMMRK